MNPRNFFAELKRRNVYKVAFAYAVVGWLLVQVTTQVFPIFEIPNWALRLIVLVIIIGFPIALVIAWAFELTHCADTILERLRERLEGETPAKLRFGVGPLPERGAESVKDPTATVPKPTPAQRDEAEQIAAEIENPELRELVAKAVAASLAMSPPGQPGRRF